MAAWTFAYVCDLKMQPRLIGLLGSVDEAVRLFGAIGLRRVGDQSAVEALIRSLGDPYDLVVCEAVYALRDIGDKRAVQPLRELKRKTRNNKIRETVESVLEHWV